MLLGTARAWDLRPIAEDGPAPPDPRAGRSVAVLVPARNEADVLPATLPALLAQDYPGAWHLVVVDDRSTDGTAGIAHAAGARHVPRHRACPTGWVGKVWALEQGRAAPASPTTTC